MVCALVFFPTFFSLILRYSIVWFVYLVCMHRASLFAVKGSCDCEGAFSIVQFWYFLELYTISCEFTSVILFCPYFDVYAHCTNVWGFLSPDFWMQAPVWEWTEVLIFVLDLNLAFIQLWLLKPFQKSTFAFCPHYSRV